MVWYWIISVSLLAIGCFVWMYTRPQYLCPQCDGTGQYNDMTCQVCAGKGKI